jgi:hypothetical protein
VASLFTRSELISRIYMLLLNYEAQNNKVNNPCTADDLGGGSVFNFTN